MSGTFPEKNLNQKAIYWARGTVDGFGEQTHSAPIEIDCRWVDMQKEYITSGAEKKISNAFVQVPQVLDIGGYLFRGTFAENPTLETETNPESVDGAYRIEAFSITPTLSADASYKEATL